MPRKTRQNQLTSPDMLAKANRENIELKKDFLNYLRSMQYSEGTISGYSHDLDIWIAWNYQYNGDKSFPEMTKRNLVAYQNWLIYENGNSPARVRRLKASLSSWSNYIEDILDDEYQGYHSIVRKVKSPINQTVRDKTVFTEDQLLGLLDTLTDQGKYMQACAVALAMYSGRRKSELLRFKADWFTDENIIYGSLYKTPEKVKTKGRGNGKYLYCYTLSTPFKPYYSSYMNWRKENGVQSEWLFYDKLDPTKQMNVSTLNSWANQFSEMLGVPYYWHALRHFFTTKLSQSGLPDSVVQTLIGWESADMVRLYDDTSVDEQIGQYFAQNDMGTEQMERK